MSVTPGPVAMPSSIAERSLGGGAFGEDGVEVADQQDARAGRVAVERADDGVAERLVRMDGDGRAEALEELGRPAPDLVDAGLRVAAAVDVDQRLEVAQEGRLVGGDGGAEARQLVGRRPRRPVPSGRLERADSDVHATQSTDSPPGARAAAILRRPCASSRSASSRDPTSTASTRPSRSRSPSGGVGPGTASGSRGATRSSGSRRPCRPASGRTRSPCSSPGVAGCGSTPARAVGGVAVHRSSDPGHWIVTFPWTGAERARIVAEAAVELAERDVSPARRATLTGGQARLLARRGRASRPPARARPPGCATPTAGSRSSRSRAPTARARSPG